MGIFKFWRRVREKKERRKSLLMLSLLFNDLWTLAFEENDTEAVNACFFAQRVIVDLIYRNDEDHDDEAKRIWTAYGRDHFRQQYTTKLLRVVDE